MAESLDFDVLYRKYGRSVYRRCQFLLRNDDDAYDAYLDAVRYVEEKYYLKVSRYTNSGFMRLKLGKALADRHVSSQIFESQREARRNLRGE